MSAWVHCHIRNQSGSELTLVDKHVSGSPAIGSVSHPHWRDATAEPPARIPSGGEAYIGAENDDFLSSISVSAVYTADVDGFALKISFGATSNEHPGGVAGAQAIASKERIINVHQTSRGPNREQEVFWVLRDWPD